MKKKQHHLFLFILFYLSIFLVNIFPQVYDGSLYIYSQAQLDTLGYYTSITGSLEIENGNDSDIVNLDVFSGLTSVGGHLEIFGNKALQNINGLSNLTSIGGHLDVSSNIVLQNLQGLNGLQNIPLHLEINYNRSLKNLTGLNNLVSVQRQIYIIGNDSLVNLTGLASLSQVQEIWVRWNNLLINLNGLNSLVTIENALRIEGNPLLASLQGIGNLKIVSQLEIIDNDGLKSLNGAGIQDAMFIRIENNDSLTNLNALSVNNTMSYHIRNNSMLENLNGLFIGSTASLFIGENSSLKSINGLILSKADRISLYNNHKLESLHGLENVQTEDLIITGCDSLKNLEGVTWQASYFNLYITDNPLLTDLDELIAVTSAYRLVITNNDHVLNLNGLVNLTSQSNHTIIITDNASLTSFCALYNYFIGDYGAAIINGNSLNPTPQQIISDGPCVPSEMIQRSYITTLFGRNGGVQTEGSGGGMFILNASRDTLEYWIRICDLSCPFISGGFYTGAEGSTGTLVKTINFFADTAGYVVHGLWTSSDPEPLTPYLGDRIINGFVFVNIITLGHPDGEIRGTLKNDVPAYLYSVLSGSEEVPPVTTDGWGNGWFALTGDGDSLYYNVSAYELSGNISAAHFHKAPFGVPGPVVKPISFAGDTLSEGWWTNTDANPLTPALVADLLGCFIYVNVHTPQHPSGEIRGQLLKTDELVLRYMTVWSAENDPGQEKNSSLSFYSLAAGSNFKNNEGEISGYNGKKNIVDMAIDAGNNIYFLNNSWTSILYKINPGSIDFDASTSVRAKQIGKIRLPDETLLNINNIEIIKGKLYGIDNKNNKLYRINSKTGYSEEIASLTNCIPSGFASGSDGSIYLLKSEEGKAEIWKFNKFPSPDLSFVTRINGTGKLNGITAHPNGNLYSSDGKSLYEINLSQRKVGILENHVMDAAAIEINFYSEKRAGISSTLNFTDVGTTTDVDDFTEMPTEYSLQQNYPNPFNPSTVIKYSLPEAAFVKLIIYNALGEAVKTLVNENRSAGTYETTFNASDVPSGVYIYRLEAGTFTSSHKMILLK